MANDDLIRMGDALSVAMPDGARRDAYVTRGEMHDLIAALEPVTPTAGQRLIAAAIREAAAKTLLDMLYMRNGAQNGMTRDDVQRIWDAASTREGYAAVEAFLLALIPKGAADDRAND